jgi:hypothetical protein
MKMGFLTLRGRVDTDSVMNFFESALPREGWRLKGEFSTTGRLSFSTSRTRFA